MFSIFLLVFFIAGLEVRAEDYTNTNYGLNTTLNTDSGKLKNTLQTGKEDLSTQIGTIIGAVLAFVGVIFLILMIYGGFLWMTAGGNEEEVKKAQSLIIAAVVGIIIISSAYLITKFIGETLIPSQTQTTTPPSTP